MGFKDFSSSGAEGGKYQGQILMNSFKMKMLLWEIKLGWGGAGNMVPGHVLSCSLTLVLPYPTGWDDCSLWQTHQEEVSETSLPLPASGSGWGIVFWEWMLYLGLPLQAGLGGAYCRFFSPWGAEAHCLSPRAPARSCPFCLLVQQQSFSCWCF